jgi:phage terminase large subunit-like protein
MSSQSATQSLAEMLAADPIEKARFLSSLSEQEAYALQWDWRFWGRPKQQEPAGEWWCWLILAGRGFGKSRTGGEWVNLRAQKGSKRIALVAETAADARDVMVEGPSGVLACAPPWNKARYEPSKRRITWENGCVAITYSAETPDQLRGPEHDTAWCDELAKWKYPDAWDQLLFGMRTPNQTPRVLVTTTPRPTPIIKQLIADKNTHTTRGSTFENRSNLAAAFIQKIEDKYGNTRLGRQELYAEVLDDAPGALWKRDEMIEAHRVTALPAMRRIVVAVDPSVSSSSETSCTGIVVAGLGNDGHGYVFSDVSCERPTPDEWGSATITAYNLHEADCIVGEVNNGGDLVESNIASRQKNLPIKKVRASRGKDIRAEPISSLYQQGKVHHVGMFAKLEDEMCQWEPGVSAWSPNRLDALVWALTELMLGAEVDDASVFRVKSNRGR